MTAAVSALAEAIGTATDCGHSSCPRDTSRHDDDARAILAHPFTPAQRAALAAEILTPEVLAVAMYDANRSHGGYECCAPTTHGDAEAILAALRESGKEPDR